MKWYLDVVLFLGIQLLPELSKLSLGPGAGGRWRFDIRLESTQPDEDGTVEIAASPGQATTVPLYLYSPAEQPLPFTMHFTSDSSVQFDAIKVQVSVPGASSLSSGTGRQSAEGIELYT